MGKQTAFRHPPHFQGGEYHGHCDLSGGYPVSWTISGQCLHTNKFPADDKIPKDAKTAVAKVLGVAVDLLEGNFAYDEKETKEIIPALSPQKEEESMNFSMPSTFPENTFQEFRKLAGKLFPPLLSDENLNDPQKQRMHFDKAWLAVLYRYRACSEHNEAFKNLFVNAMANDLWREWSKGDEHHYKLEQCLYHFFMNALSVLESLGFCLYFFCGMVDPKNFAGVCNPKNITLKATRSAFEVAFPHASITHHLRELLKDPEFIKIEEIRNILAHRLTSWRTVISNGSTDPDGTYSYTREEFWHIPGLKEDLVFDEKLIQRHFDEVTRLVTTLISASLEFAKPENR